ncbi:unnamed protein product [Coregonus sp. 'balchen']|nr:unnamed protein product [Coregonus sp. 'balchen']
MRRGLAVEPAAVREYCHIKNVNYMQCGFVIHPDALWLGSSSDGLVYDPIESPPFGRLDQRPQEVKLNSSTAPTEQEEVHF